MHSLLLVPVLLPLLGGLAVFHLHKSRPRRVYVAVLLSLELLLLLTLDWQAAPRRLLAMTPDVVLTLAPDALGRLFALPVSAIWLLAGIYAFGYMSHEEHRERFFAFYVMALGALVGICLSGNLVTLYLFYEMMTLLTVPFVIHSGEGKAIDAGIKYLGFSVCGAALGLLGLFYLQGQWTGDLFVPGGVLGELTSRPQLLAAFFLMLVGFGAKAGLFPLFAWLPTAHPVAPSPASAVLSGLITKMGVLAIIRVIYYQFGMDFLTGSWAQTAGLWLAIFTIFMGSMLAYKEKLLKKRLAYSTVSQVSYILFGMLLLNRSGFQGAMLQFVFHAFAKNGLFLAAGAIIFYTGHTRVTELRGVGRSLPCTMAAFTLCSFSLIGIPPTGGFVSKFYLAQGGLELGFVGLFGVAVLMLSALLTAGYLLPVITDAFFPGDDFACAGVKKCENSLAMKLPLLLLAAAVLVLGAFPGVVEGLIAPVTAALFS